MSRTKDIKEIMNLAYKTRLEKDPLVPCFVGEAGVGKSQGIQQWAKGMQKEISNFGFIDVRLAYYERPDVIGLPNVIEVKGEAKTSHILPDKWPTEGAGVLLFEEPNRADQGVMNTMMQVLTDRKFDKYTLPEGWSIALAINPENGYEVNALDTALRDRVAMVDVEYDHQSFIAYMESTNWHPNVINFVKSGAWVYKKPSEIGTEGSYISPRTLSRLSSSEHAGMSSNPEIHFTMSTSILGKAVGNTYYKFVFDNSPVMLNDILANKEAALTKLKNYADVKNLRGDLLGVTVDSVSDDFKDLKTNRVTDDILNALAEVLPAEQFGTLMKTIVNKSKGTFPFADYLNANPKAKEILKAYRDAGLNTDKSGEKVEKNVKSRKK